MSYREDLGAEPFRFDFFAAMREFERSYPDKPRIGDSATVAQDVVQLGQDPYLEFPASNVTKYEVGPDGSQRVLTRFLGYFGPQGALPLSTTLEAFSWQRGRDSSFPRFADIFANRFLQLFYRAWADARPIAQRDRPKQDRFVRYVGSLIGIGTDASLDRDSVEDIGKIHYAGLIGSHVKSASRLRQLIRGIFKVDAEIEERIGSWLVFEPGDQMALGRFGSGLGQDAFLGGRAYSINERVRIAIRTTSLEQYRSFLPTGEMSERLADLIFFYLGHRYEFDVQLALPARYAPAARLGVSGQLGWTAWMAPKADAAADTYFDDARFDPMERRRAMATDAGRKKKRGSKSGG